MGFQLTQIVSDPRLHLQKFHWKTPVLDSLFNKVAVLRPASLLKRDSNTRVFL